MTALSHWGREHRFVPHSDVPAFERVGWVAYDTLRGTVHGLYSIHCAWLCDCEVIVPDPDLDCLMQGIRELSRPLGETA